jgi:hypothetical protein
VFQLSLIEVVCRIYSDWMIPLGQNRSSFQIAIKLQNSHFPRGGSTSTRQKIANGSVAATKKTKVGSETSFASLSSVKFPLNSL